ncbi:hypothetical protein GX411_09385 [Candidatus Fermentibacteria bacterium]|nr:hypothetical protein [Candidatus Fermentibacteria bacterium]
MKKKWLVRLDDGEYSVEIRQNQMSGSGSILINGSTVSEFSESGESARMMEIEYGRHRFKINIVFGSFQNEYNLTVDGSYHS